MADSKRAGHFTLATSGSTQTFTIAGETRTPKAAYFVLTGVTADSTYTPDAMTSRGATDGTNEWYGCVFSQDAVNGTVTRGRKNTNGVMALVDSTSALIAKLSFNSWTAGGVVLDIDTTPAAAYKADILFFFEGTYEAGTHTTAGTLNTQTTQTGMGFDPTFLILHEQGTAAFAASTNVDARLSIGYVAENAASGVLQSSMAWAGLDGQFTSNRVASVTATYGLCYVDIPAPLGGGSGVYTIEFDLISGGFGATPRINALAHVFGYLAGTIPDEDQWSGVLASPGSTGSYDITEPNLEVFSGLIAQCGIRTPSIDTWLNGAAAAPIGTSMFTQYETLSSHIVSRHNQRPTDTSSHCAPDKVISYSFLTTSNNGHEGTYTSSRPAGGFTANFTAATSLERIWPSLLWGSGQDEAALDEGVGIGETVFGVVFNSPRGSERLQAGRSGMDAGQAGRAGMDRGQRGRSR